MQRPIRIKFAGSELYPARCEQDRKSILGYPDTCECYSYPMKLSSDRMG